MSDLWSNIDRLIETKKSQIDGNIVNESIYRFIPVPFKEFVEGKQYCNFIKLSKKQLDACYAMLYGHTFDEYTALIDRPINIFENPRFNIAALLWGKGSGKDTICALMTLYIAYFCGCCCKNPQQLLGIPDNDAIDIVNVAYSADQANRAFFEKLKQRTLHNSWLRKYFNIEESGAVISEKSLDMTTDTIKVGANAIIFPNLVRLFSRHSEQESSEGLNILCFTMDEADAFKAKTQVRNAEKIYNMLQTSAESRFGAKYKGFLISYPRTDRGFMMKMMSSSENDLHMYADRAFTWEVKTEFYAGHTTFPFDIIRKDSENKEYKDTYQIPIDFQSFFTRNPTMAKQMYMCMPPGAESPFIEYVDRLYECIDKARLPMFEFESIYDTSEEKVRKKLTKMRLPDDAFKTEYVLTIDLGQKHDKCALSIMHRDGEKAVHDLSISWRPQNPDTQKKFVVDFTNVREIVKEISKVIRIKVMLDRWQSSLFVEDFRAAGIQSDVYSLQVKDYNNFMDFIYTKRIVLLDCNELIEEIKMLERDEKGRVDHTCFTGDTKISLVDGREITLAEAVEEFKQGGINSVYTIDPSTSRIGQSIINNPRITKNVDRLIEVELDNGEKIRCTENHRFLLRSGKYIRADKLMPLDSLMPLYRKYPTKGGLQNYRMMWDNENEKWKFEHRHFVFVNEIIRRGFVVHHKNFNKNDNTDANLVAISKAGHTIIHNNSTKDYGALSKTIADWHKNNKDSKEYKDMHRRQREKVSGSVLKFKSGIKRLTKLLRNVCKKTPEGVAEIERLRAVRASIAISAAHKKNPDAWQSSRDGMQKWNLSEIGRQTHARLFRKVGLNNKGKKMQHNHKVVSIKYVDVDNIPMYDIEVPGFNNFALSAGVFVHNSEGEKDMSDTICGGIRTLFMTELITTQEGGEFITENLQYQGGDIIQ